VGMIASNVFAVIHGLGDFLLVRAEASKAEDAVQPTSLGSDMG